MRVKKKKNQLTVNIVMYFPPVQAIKNLSYVNIVRN